MLGALALIAFFHPALWGKGTELTVKVESTPVNRDAKLGASLAPVVKKAAPSVVNIYSTHIVQLRPCTIRFLTRFPPLFWRPDGRQPRTDRRDTGWVPA